MRMTFQFCLGFIFFFFDFSGYTLDIPKPPKPVIKIPQEKKDAYIASARAFGAKLGDLLQDSDGMGFYHTIFI